MDVDTTESLGLALSERILLQQHDNTFDNMRLLAAAATGILPAAERGRMALIRDR